MDRYDDPVPHVPPSTPIEHFLAEVWEDLLGVEQVGVHDDFFALGGQSLQAVRLLSRIRARIKGNWQTNIIHEHRTIAALAAVLDASSAADATANVSSIPRLRRPGQ